MIDRRNSEVTVLAHPSDCMAAATRAHRKALPTFSGRCELSDELLVIQVLMKLGMGIDSNSAQKRVASAIAGVVGDAFEMGGSMGRVVTLRCADVQDDTLRDKIKTVVRRWADAGWPKRVVFALAGTTPFCPKRESIAEAMLAKESDAKVLVGNHMLPSVEDEVAFMIDLSMVDPETSEGGNIDFEPGLVLAGNTHNYDSKFYLGERTEVGQRQHLEQTRLVVLQRGSCVDRGHCGGVSCRRAALALWAFVGCYRDWCGNDSLSPELSIAEVFGDNDEDEWYSLAAETFKALPVLQPCQHRLAVRIDTTCATLTDQSGVYLSVPLPTACDAGDYDISYIALTVTTD